MNPLRAAPSVGEVGLSRWLVVLLGVLCGLLWAGCECGSEPEGPEEVIALVDALLEQG